MEMMAMSADIRKKKRFLQITQEKFINSKKPGLIISCA